MQNPGDAKSCVSAYYESEHFRPNIQEEKTLKQVQVDSAYGHAELVISINQCTPWLK